MKCKPLAVNYGIYFNTILFPINLVEFVDGLEKKGYEISSAIPFPRPPGRLVGAGEIARKGKTVVQVDASAQMLNIADISLKSALGCFDEIASMLTEDYGVNIDSLARFYNFSATYEIRAEKQAYEMIAKNLKVSVIDDFEKIMQEEIWPLELRFGGAGLRTNSEDWFDFSIRPSYERNDSYITSVVYRNKDKAKAQKFVETCEEKILKMVELIDR